MIKCEVIEQFNLKDFYKLNNIKRKSIDIKGTLFIGDSFECDEGMVKYLTGNNEQGKTVVKVIEVEPYEAKIVDANKVEVKVIEKPKKKKSSKINRLNKNE